MLIGQEIPTFEKDVKVFHVGPILVGGRAGVNSFLV